jgi:CheY-like chemotaxis protein
VQTDPVILVAEDDDELRELIVQRLSKMGAHVVEVEDGLEMIDYITLTQRAGRHPIPMPSLMVTDVRMPGATGLEVVRSVRSSGFGLPVVVLTAFPDAGVLAEAQALGATWVFTKPMDLDDLAHVVQSILALHLHVESAQH